jgi:hypothetical protein
MDCGGRQSTTRSSSCRLRDSAIDDSLVKLPIADLRNRRLVRQVAVCGTPQSTTRSSSCRLRDSAIDDSFVKLPFAPLHR